MIKRGGWKNKKGAFELSITTMIVIVLAIVMLIMGLILIKNIFFGATESVDSLNEKVKTEIDRIFTEENKKVVVYLGELKIAAVKAGDSFGIAIGAKTLTGTQVKTPSDLQYKMSLDESARENCLSVIGKEQTTNLFKQKLEEWINLEEYQADNAKSIIQVAVPEGTTLCTQKVLITVRDKTQNPDGTVVGGDYFILDIKRSGLF